MNAIKSLFNISVAKSAIVALTFSGSCAAVSAQNLHESVNVEGVYRIEVVQPERINVFPRHEDVSLERADLNFDTDGVPAQFAPTALPMGITGWRTAREASPRGYIDLSLGSWLNSSLSAGYDVIRKKDTRLSVSLQHNSTSLWRPDLSEATHDVRRFRYDESAAARFARTFSGKGLLEASLDYHFGYFNYYSYLPHAVTDIPGSAGMKYKAPTQTLNDLSAMAAWSNPSGLPLQWNVGLRARYFGYRSLYLPGTAGNELQALSGERETRLDLLAGLSRKWEAGSQIGLDAEGSLLLYSGLSHLTHSYVNLPSLPDYGMLILKPYYRFTRNNFIINAGVDIDLTFNADGDTPDSHYSLFHIAPDIRIDWRREKFGMWIKLLGGSTPQTLASGSVFNYYRLPALPSTQPIYTPADASVGFEFGKWKGISAGVGIAYRATKHVPLDGWYMAILNYGASPMPGLPAEAQFPTYGTGYQGIDLHGFSFDLHAAYEYGNIVKAEGSVKYQPQHGSRGWWNGLDRPRWVLNAGLDVRPIKPLHIGIGYEYRGVRSIYTAYAVTESSPVVEQSTRLASYRLPDICNLKASASYDISNRLNVGVRAYNLLNHRIESLPCLLTEGIDIQGVISYKF